MQQPTEKSPRLRHPTKGGHPMRFTKRNLIKTAAVSSALLEQLLSPHRRPPTPSDRQTMPQEDTQRSVTMTNDQFCVTGTGRITQESRSTIKRAERAELLYFSRPRGNKVRQPSTILRGHSLILSGRRSSYWKKLRPIPLLQLT